MPGKHRSERRRVGRPSAAALGTVAALAVSLVGAGVVVASLRSDDGGTVTAQPTSSVPAQPSASPTATLATDTAPPQPSPAPVTPSATGAPKPRPTSRPTTRPARPAPPRPTLELASTRGTTYVLVRVPGGPVLFDGTTRRGQRLRWFQPRLSVVIGNAGATWVVVNGKVTPPGGRGVVRRFTVVRR